MDFNTPGFKDDTSKPQAELLLDFSRALTEVVKVGTYGAQKYTKGGWLTVSDGINRYTGAMIRHQLLEPNEQYDAESGLAHEAHLAWNALARLELMLREEEYALHQQITSYTFEERPFPHISERLQKKEKQKPTYMGERDGEIPSQLSCSERF